MSMLRRLGLAALLAACSPWGTTQASVYLGVGFGGPYYRPYYRPWYGYGYGYGYYRPFGGVYVAPPPIVVGATPPVVVQQPVVVQPAYSPTVVQTPAPLPAPAPANTAAAPATPSAPDVMPAVATGANGNPADLDFYVQQLRTGDEAARADAVVRLGKMRAERAVGPMVKALNSDPSPRVREAAARGLGLLASPSALTALQYAAQGDDDREVRHSASFAAEVIRGNLRR